MQQLNEIDTQNVPIFVQKSVHLQSVEKHGTAASVSSCTYSVPHGASIVSNSELGLLRLGLVEVRIAAVLVKQFLQEGLVRCLESNRTS